MSTKYPLARLLRLRKMKEDQAATELALAQRREQQALAKVERAQEELNGHVIQGEFSEALWRSSIAAQVARRSTMLEAIGLAEVAAEHTASAKGDWQDARRESKPLEKLEERFKETQAIEEARAENAVLDEIASIKKNQELGR